MKKIKIAYIGGGSRLWARNLMSDMALEKDLGGEVALYDIVAEAAKNNAIIGNNMMAKHEALGDWRFTCASSLEEALTFADFVLISILPGTFEEMRHYVHDTEKWGLYQTVGDTVGPAGIFRGLIMMPMYEVIAKAIQSYAPKAWVLNFTNPMTLCVQTLYNVFPEIKAFGNCHEVFFVQRILSRVLKEKTGLDIPYHDIRINPLGINHFTWINHATYDEYDIMPMYQEFVEQYHDIGLLPKEDDWKHVGPFGSAEKVKLDLFHHFQVIAAAGDRHLVEFLPHAWYLNGQDQIDQNKFHLTKVQTRIDIMNRGNESAIRIRDGLEEVSIHPSGEDGIEQIKALLGLTELITNVNMPNLGQISNLPLGHVVETNALFRKDSVRPIMSGEMEPFPATITKQHILTHQLLWKAYVEKDLSFAREALGYDQVTMHLSPDQIDAMFDEIIGHIQPYLTHYERGIVR